MDLMNRVFQNYLDSFVIVIVDIFVYLMNEDDHMVHLMEVFKIHKEHQMYAKYSKCEFWMISVTFHGHITSSEGVEVDPRKIEAVKNFPRQLTRTNISSFIGLEDYYRRFVDGFSSIVSPLSTLTQKSKIF